MRKVDSGDVWNGTCSCLEWYLVLGSACQAFCLPLRGRKQGGKMVLCTELIGSYGMSLVVCTLDCSLNGSHRQPSAPRFGGAFIL